MESIPSGHRMNLILWCGFLLLAYFICNVHSQECGTNQYKFRENNEKCCQKCHPGERMDKRCTANRDTVCIPCSPDFFMTEFSTEMECKRCTQCTKEYMVYKVNCSKATDALCDCESGYKCNDNKCTDCVKIPKTTPPPTTTTKTSAIIVTTKMDKQSFTQDTHLHVDGSCRLQLVLFGAPEKVTVNPVSAQKRRKCQCQSKRCLDMKSGRKRSEGGRRKPQGIGRKRHIRVWIDYVL
ncbi:tumor necrosis factor receptor superfamily member 26 isoform X1 [Clarias gariepinus]|uniref:tumor necrosis factor receptor superfamily member 26 isoform X1 n=2 Tax=Clarias gariepinus TaxID=13013 RepID=UPI00234C49E8|nr:tumor necrosis factor receptor superfamily member 26 isoform X1 [Clarias gariepinus]